MKFFISQPVHKEAKSTYMLSKVDVEKKENLLPVKMVKLATDAADLLKKLSSNLHDGVRKGFTIMLQTRWSSQRIYHYASTDDKKYPGEKSN